MTNSDVGASWLRSCCECRPKTCKLVERLGEETILRLVDHLINCDNRVIRLVAHLVEDGDERSMALALLEEFDEAPGGIDWLIAKDNKWREAMEEEGGAQ
jgi:hypothetical protein